MPIAGSTISVGFLMSKEHVIGSHWLPLDLSDAAELQNLIWFNKSVLEIETFGL